MRGAILLLLSVAAATAIWVAGCSPTPPDPSLINTLRVLAIRASPPEVIPGSSSRMDALVVDPTGGGRPLTMLWGVCVPNLIDGVTSCTDPAHVQILGPGPTAKVEVSPWVLADLPLLEWSTGIDLFVVLEVTAPATATAPAEQLVAFKRLHVSTSQTPDRNPEITRFAINGSNFGAVVMGYNQKTELEVAVTPGSNQTYYNRQGAPQSEQMMYSWYETAGAFNNDTTFQDPDGGGRVAWTSYPPATLWVVVQDQRDGVDWAIRTVTTAAQPAAVVGGIP